MKDHLSDPNELDETLEVGLGRRAPFSQLGDWVLFSGVDSDARTLYWGLSAHINTSVRDDTEVWPGLAALARILQLKKPENVSKYMLQLEVIGAIEVVRTMVGLVRRNRYIVHQTPPTSHTGARSTSEWYALNRGPKGETPEARKARESEFDQWLLAVRDGLKAHCDSVAKARAAAKKAKAAFPPIELFIAPVLTDFRTPAGGGTARPAPIQKPTGRTVPPRQGVRTPAEGGSVPPPQGVERDQYQLDQSLSPYSPVPEAPADRTSPTKGREIPAPPTSTTPAADAGVGEEPGAAAVAEQFAILWKAARGTRPGRRQLDSIALDVAEAIAAEDSLEWLTESVVPFMVSRNYLDLARAKTHPQCPAPQGTKVPGQRPGVLEWCGECNDGIEPELVAERFRRHGGRLVKCPECHPGGVRQSAAV
ncbi:hypothetical protein [Streptomyces sp. NPDC048636]|uniref:hypothetical protein n=1 Tax=Streptomyces sp. NPDC048636 TaxID=3155762 RepID=UPI003427C58C